MFCNLCPMAGRNKIIFLNIKNIIMDLLLLLKRNKIVEKTRHFLSFKLQNWRFVVAWWCAMQWIVRVWISGDYYLVPSVMMMIKNLFLWWKETHTKATVEPVNWVVVCVCFFFQPVWFLVESNQGLKIGTHSFPAWLTFRIKIHNVKPASCVVDNWTSEQLDTMAASIFPCLVAKVTWRINWNCNFIN